MSKLFRALNRPQQVRKRGPDDRVDDRATPLDLFQELDAEFKFTLDVAASLLNRKTERFFSKDDDGLAQSWAGERVWCNPPYSDIRPWVAKALAETREGGCELAVLLLPNNRQEQPWWQDMIEPVRDRIGSGVSTRFIRRRRNFGTTEGAEIKYKSSPPFGLVAVIFRGGLK
jgi:phage N-6-adenine-methyltransferase